MIKSTIANPVTFTHSGKTRIYAISPYRFSGSRHYSGRYPPLPSLRHGQSLKDRYWERQEFFTVRNWVYRLAELHVVSCRNSWCQITKLLANRGLAYANVPEFLPASFERAKVKHTHVQMTIAAVFVFAPTFASADIAGTATVVDGNTLIVGEQRVRLSGVDAPEMKQTCIADGAIWDCGSDAADALANKIGQSTVFCRGGTRDPNGDLVAVCFSGRDDINQWLVMEGWAVANRFDSGDYTDEESVARMSRRGIWRGEFMLPSLWREGKRVAGEVVAEQTGECLVKGDLNDRGVRIYYEPGHGAYESVEIDESGGERWFCTAEEAQRHGFRPAK